MRYLELRRHSHRHAADQHLSPQGISLARAVGATVGPFARVVTSTLPRAIETAEAMGFPVDTRLPELAEMAPSMENVIHWAAGYARFSDVMESSSVAAHYGRRQEALCRSLVTSVPDGAGVLVVTHGRIIEATAVACLPQGDHAAWGPAYGYCEGIRLAYDGDGWCGAEVLRVTFSWNIM